MTDRTELRRLLEKATPGPWALYDGWLHEGRAHVARIGNAAGNGIGAPITDMAGEIADFELIVAAVNALPSLLDQLDAAEAALARVRELHASSGTAESQGYGAHGVYGFIAPYCTGCEASDEYAVAWPCPTIAAIGGEQ